jgi:hypothetical protein
MIQQDFFEDAYPSLEQQDKKEITRDFVLQMLRWRQNVLHCEAGKALSGHLQEDGRDSSILCAGFRFSSEFRMDHAPEQ